MQDIHVAAVQFCPTPQDKKANLAVIERHVREAVEDGAEMVVFPECCITGYNYWGMGDTNIRPCDGKVFEPDRYPPAWTIPQANPFDHAEPVPDGPSTRAVVELAREYGVIISAGLMELGPRDEGVYNCYLLAGPDGYIGKYRKSHCVPGQESTYFRLGNALPVFDCGKIKVGVLICYDNHHPEAHRILSAKGANVILMPHVTVSRQWWGDLDLPHARQQARNWILTWLRARAFDNEVFAVFANEVGDGESGPLGCTMILDPDGHVIAECQTPTEEHTSAVLSAKKFYDVRRRTHDYMTHRRPELYNEILLRYDE